jgi:hypothetical protein
MMGAEKILSDFYANDGTIKWSTYFFYKKYTCINKTSRWFFGYKKFVSYILDNIKTLSIMRKKNGEKFFFRPSLKSFLKITQKFPKEDKTKYINFSEPFTSPILTNLFFKKRKIQEKKKWNIVKEILVKMAIYNFNPSVLKLFENNKRTNLINVLLYDLFERLKYDSLRFKLYSRIFFILFKERNKNNRKLRARLLIFHKSQQKEEMERIKSTEMIFWAESHFEFSKSDIRNGNSKHAYLIKKKEEFFSVLPFLFFLWKKEIMKKNMIKSLFGCLFLYFKSNRLFLKNWAMENMMKFFKFFPPKNRKNFFGRRYLKKIKKKILILFCNFRNKRMLFFLLELLCKIHKFALRF